MALAGSIYRVKFNFLGGTMTPPERDVVFTRIFTGVGKFHEVVSAVVMPDHVHLLFGRLSRTRHRGS